MLIIDTPTWVNRCPNHLILNIQALLAKQRCQQFRKVTLTYFGIWPGIKQQINYAQIRNEAPTFWKHLIVRFEVNNQDTTAAAAAVQIFPITAGINDLAIYTLKFDFWQAYNGGVAGGGGSTEFIQVGGHALGTQAEWPSASASSGFFWTMTADGGAAQDVRYYEGAGAAAPTRDDTIPNWWDENAINMVIGDETTWQTIFPAPPYKSAGAPGHAWTTVEMQVNGPAVSVFITSASPGNRVKVASWNTTNGAGSGIPFIGYWDGFSSIENPIGDNFLLIDNLSITVPEVTSIPGREWSNYR